MSRRAPFRLIANFYIWVFRGTPLLVQLVFFFFGLAQRMSTIGRDQPARTLDPGEIQAGIFRARPQRGRLHVPRSCGPDHLDRCRADGGREVARHDIRPRHAPHRPAPGRADHRPAAGQRCSTNMLQDHVPAVRDRRPRSSTRRSPSSRARTSSRSRCISPAALCSSSSRRSGASSRPTSSEGSGKGVAGASHRRRTLWGRMFGGRGPVDPQLVRTVAQ